VQHHVYREKGALMQRAFWLAFLGTILLTTGARSQSVVQPVKVEIRDEKPIAVETVLPLDPTRYILQQPQGNMMVRLTVENRTLHLGFIQTTLKVDGQVLFPGANGRFDYQNRPLPKRPGGKERIGFETMYVHNPNIHIRQVVETVPTKPAEKVAEGQKRRLDAALITYEIENKDSQAHEVGLRIFMDMFLVDNDGALFAAPTQPGKILNGVELKGKEVPRYLQVLQKPDLKAPGYVAHFTYSLGRQYEMPQRVVLTSLGAQRDNWELMAVQAGDSAMGFYWEPKKIQPGGKRVLAYAYGQGMAVDPENDALVKIVLGGSFEPGKEFTIAAHIADPAPGQTLTLELPPGMQRLEGAERQPVSFSESGETLVLWKARVLQVGQYPIRVHSNTGVTETKLVTIRPSGQ